jgi:hypothetical protein
VLLLGRREVDDGWEVAGQLLSGERLAAGSERLGGRGLYCWAGERWTTVVLLGGRGQDC